MAIGGILGGFNEQRAAGANYLSTLDQMRRAQIAQQLEAQRQQAQQSQFGQELAQRQAQAQQTAELERARMGAQQQQFGQEFGLRAQEQGLRGQEFGMKQAESARTAQQRNALQSLLSQSDLGTAELGRAILPYDTATGIGLIKSAREEEAARRREQQEADKAARDEWQIFEKEGVRVNKTTGAVEKLDMPMGASSAKMPADIQRMTLAMDALGTGMQSLKTEMKDFNPRNPLDQMDPTKRARIGSLVADLRLQAKEAQALGALTGPDVGMLEKVLADPTTFSGAYIGKEGIGEQIGQAEKALTRRGEALAKQYHSYQPPKFERGEETAQNWQSTYKSQAAAVQDAMEAIRKGAPRDAVRQRLQQIGITDARL